MLAHILPTPTHEEAAFYANAPGLESLTARKLTIRQPLHWRLSANTLNKRDANSYDLRGARGHLHSCFKQA